MILYYSGVLDDFDDGTVQIGLEFIVISLVFFSGWIISIIMAAVSEEKSIVKHILLASVVPCKLGLIASNSKRYST